MLDNKYFKHDATASSNYKLMGLLDKEGLKGYGAYWLLLETLRGMPEFKAPMSILVILAKKVRVKSLSLRRIVENYGLFVVADGYFFSPGLCKRLESYVQKTAKVSVKANVNDPRKSLTMSDSNSLSGREIELKENNNSNNTVADPVVTSVAAPVVRPVAAPVVRPVATQLPLVPIRPWQSLVDEMTTDRSWMDMVGTHSALGQLYIDHREEIVELFRQHIRLYDKGGGLLRLQDVKQYFVNYLAAGSRTCQAVRERLLDDIRRRQASAGASPYETLIDGRRTYLGRVIPDDAPPRPDAFSVWDEEKHKWTR